MAEIVATNVVASRPPNGDRLQCRPLVPKEWRKQVNEERKAPGKGVNESIEKEKVDKVIKNQEEEKENKKESGAEQTHGKEKSGDNDGEEKEKREQVKKTERKLVKEKSTGRKQPKEMETPSIKKFFSKIDHKPYEKTW